MTPSPSSEAEGRPQQAAERIRAFIRAGNMWASMSQQKAGRPGYEFVRISMDALEAALATWEKWRGIGTERNGEDISAWTRQSGDDMIISIANFLPVEPEVREGKK